MPRSYEFKTVWLVESRVSNVWREIEDSANWPEWWKGVLSVDILENGDADGIGKVIRSVWKSALPYRLVFNSEVTRVEKEKTIEVRAFGELEGTGIWHFDATDDEVTKVVYDWSVITEKPWMNLIAPVAKPLFRWNHDTIMRWGVKGLSKRLNCKVSQ